MLRYLLLVLLCICSAGAASQNLEILTSGTATNLRGIGVFKNTIWASGSNGYVGRSTDAGRSWEWKQVAGFETKDFRDIEVLDEHTALIMVIASPAYILKTSDDGHTWKTVFENRDTAMFLDAMAFANKQTGYVIGDPVQNKLFIAQTTDGGNSWTPVPGPAALPGEAFFASSGSNLVIARQKPLMVSGGVHSRIFNGSSIITRLPLMQGTQSTGANSIAAFGQLLMIAGGDFQAPDRRDSILLISKDGGKSFLQPQNGPRGYRSAIAPFSKNAWITCGLNGVDMTNDGGLNWEAISERPFNSIYINRPTKTAYLAGPGGTIASFVTSEN
ncbi:WD40/YVTN/BNR-like repeat-containing protein [Niabella hirudinis]|uniref:WD40/YVTN/BNR-like repeat-containing protein n=1 Tax=Niabella hirudinis TaxID=1285929 RepID=UPI003EC0A261